MTRHGRKQGALLALGLLAVCSESTAQDASADRCIAASARYNRLPEALLLAIRRQEGGRIGYWHNNPDGSMDYGVMQINSRWLPVLAPKGYTAVALVYNACASIAAGSWILAQQLAGRSTWNQPRANAAAYWRAIGDYHSHTPELNRAYAEEIWARYLHLSGQKP